MACRHLQTRSFLVHRMVHADEEREAAYRRPVRGADLWKDPTYSYATPFWRTALRWKKDWFFISRTNSLVDSGQSSELVAPTDLKRCLVEAFALRLCPAGRGIRGRNGTQNAEEKCCERAVLLTRANVSATLTYRGHSDRRNVLLFLPTDRAPTSCIARRQAVIMGENV